jgi:drug/metabolite transporter (DMT)-like permease
MSEVSIKAATLFGFLAIVFWGSNLPLARLAVPHLGLGFYIAIVFLLVGLSGIASQIARSPSKRLDLSGFTSPYFWLRGLFFVFHEVGVNVAVTQVSHPNLPLVILVNYFWPTAIILCSIPIAGVRVHRPIWFSIGTAIVLASLAAEILGPTFLGAHHEFGAFDLWMIVLTLFGAISWGLYTALTRRFGDVSGGARATPFYQLAIGVIAPIVLTGIGSTATPATGEAIPLLAYGIVTYIVLSQFIAFKCWDLGVSKGSIVVLSLAADFIPWISLSFAALFLGSEIGGVTMIAAVTLVAGAMITRYGTLARKQ